MHQMKWNGLLFALMFVCGMARAEKVVFTPEELFRVPFGSGRAELGKRIEKDNLIIPCDFTMDGAGHFYIYDPNKHRIVRFSSEGRYEMEFRYLETAQQIFAHPDARQNLWLLISDPRQGLFYGVYDSRGKYLRSGIFSQFNRFRFYVGDDYTLHAILSSDKNPALVQMYFLDPESLRMKKDRMALPPEDHHQVRKNDRVYFVDVVPDAGKEDAPRVNRITDTSRRRLADIRGTVVYITEQGDVYTRVGEREIRVYDIGGALKGKLRLTGLSSACASIRFDSQGHLYQLDGIPAPADDPVKMPGMRLIRWQRQ